MIGSIENAIISYSEIEVQEDLEEDKNNDNMQLYKETSVGTYAII